MLPPFDIFRAESNKDVLWIEAVADLTQARNRIRNLMERTPGDYIILSQRTGNKIVFSHENISAAYKHQIFQIGYNKTLMNNRAEMLESRGHKVTSVVGNDEAKTALEQNADYDLIVIGHGAHAVVRTEMAAWVKNRFPKIRILALNPPSQLQLPNADVNLLLNGPEEWLLVVETCPN